MRCKLWLNLRRCAEGLVIQYVEIFFYSARRIFRISRRRVPFLLRCGVLFVRIGFNQAGIRRKALTTHQTIRDAARNGRFEQVSQQIAITEPAMRCPVGDCVAICREGRFLENVE